MPRRFVSIWFRHLATDWFSLRKPQLKKLSFVLRTPSHGRMIITGINDVAAKNGISCGMALADARAIFPELEVMDDKPDLPEKLLKRIAEWCIRFTPIVALDLPDGLIFDATGCSHLWGGDQNYLNDITRRLSKRGYDVRVAMADTPGAAWAVARFGNEPLVVESRNHLEALMPLPPEALRTEIETSDRLHKLGLHEIRQFIHMPRASLRRRFGPQFLLQIDKAIGNEIELIHPVIPVEAYQERLPCLEPIVTATGIEIALEELLKTLCLRLQQEQKGLRSAVLKGYRVDGKTEQVSIGTNRPTHHVSHLKKLFEPKLSSIEPALGIELFVLEAPVVEDYLPHQEKIWEGAGGLDDIRLSELIDRLASKIGMDSIHRYLPDEHYWPERSFKPASLDEKSTTTWRSGKSRPLKLLRHPERIQVSVLLPDYPPFQFNHKGKKHVIIKADGPERIEQEWWLQRGEHRDYYRVEDEDGNRYWIFRLGHYTEKNDQWFLHGFFA